MDDKAHLFFSTLPVLTDYVTIIAEITTSGPHLLHSACCRALLRRINNILGSPAITDNKHVYIVAHKHDIVHEKFREIIPQCNLKMCNVTQLTSHILQTCLDFTIHTFIHPQWTRINNRYYQGRSCLFKNTWMGCVRSQLTVQDQSVVMAIKGTVAKLAVARLSAFHIRTDIIQLFMKKEIRSITQQDMGDNTCYVLPSFKPALVHSISYDISATCPLKDSSDMVAYWIDYHGMLIPSDTEIFVTLSFNFPGAPVMTYPYYCVRKSFPVTKPSTHLLSLESYVEDINRVLRNKLPKLQLQFPITPAFSALPTVKEPGNCLSSVPAAGKVNAAPFNIPKSPPHTKNMMLPLTDHRSPENGEGKTSGTSDAKLKPRFSPYAKPKAQQITSSTSIGSTNSNRIVPVFQAQKVMEQPPRPSEPENNRVKPTFAHCKPAQTINKKSSEANGQIITVGNMNMSTIGGFNTKTKVAAVPINSIRSPGIVPQYVPSVPGIGPQYVPSVPGIVPSAPKPPEPLQHDHDLDDFDFDDSSQKTPRSGRQSPFCLTPSSQNRSTSNPSSQMRTPKTPLSQAKKKPRAPPKILATEEIFAMFRRGLLDKVNSHSLGVFLKSKKLKGVNKMKKEQLIYETQKLLTVQPQREL